MQTVKTPRSVDADLGIYLNIGMTIKYSKTCVKRPPSKRPKICFQDQLSLDAGQ